MMDRSRDRATRPGFTLLEMMISIGIFLALITAAFSLVGATSELMTEVSEVQNASSIRLRFMDVCRNAFESTDLNSSLEIEYVESNGGWNSYLSFVNTPTAFDFGVNLEDEIDRVVLAGELRPDGSLRTGVYYMTAFDWEEAQQSGFSGIRAPYVELVPRMFQLSWRFYNENGRNEEERWPQSLEGTFDPSMVKLTMRIARDEAPIESNFPYFGGASGGFPGGNPLRP